MRVVINKQHLSLNEKLAKEVNRLAGGFNNKKYSKIENIDKMLLKQDISVEKKKSILLKQLHNSVLEAFSIDKKKFNKKAFEALKKKLHNLRKLIIKLRSINYYLETAFLGDLTILSTNAKGKNPKSKQQTALAKDELGALEYTTYKLIGEVVMLDKRLISGFSGREKKVLIMEKSEVKDLNSILKKESEVLEHLEAKLPPPKAATISLMKEPTFTHWIARVFSLLSYMDHIYGQEKTVFSRLKKNKSIQGKIKKKIMHIIREKSKLIRIMEEKAISMKTFKFDKELKKELHHFTAAINL